jgi:hypothetical protein
MLMTPPRVWGEPEGVFHSHISRAFYDYWRGLALRRGGVPLREDVDPGAVTQLLPHIFIVEKRADSGRFFFRLSGTGIRNVMGFENTNHFLDELLRGDDLQAVSEMFEQVLSQGVCIRSIEGLTYSDRSYLRAEIVRLPLRRSPGDCSLVIGCLSRIENDSCARPAPGAVMAKQVIQIHNDVVPRSAFAPSA